jgi:HEAT repeat protein
LDLKDKNQDVRINAARVLYKMGPSAVQAVPALIEALGDANENVVGYASAALAEIGVAALPALGCAMEDKNENIRREAIRSIRSMDRKAKKKAVTKLIELVQKHEDFATRIEAIRSLTSCRDEHEAVIPALSTALALDKSEYVREAAVEGLMNFGPKASRAVPQLVAVMKSDLLDEERERVGWSAAEALACIGSDAVPLLSETVKDARCPRKVRHVAITSLWRMAGIRGPDAPKKAVPALVEVVGNDRDEDLRCRAADALGRMNDSANAASADLLKVLDDGNVKVRLHCARALNDIDARNWKLTVAVIMSGLRSHTDYERELADVFLQ